MKRVLFLTSRDCAVLLHLTTFIGPWLAALGPGGELASLCLCEVNECRSASGASGQLHASHEGQMECLLYPRVTNVMDMLSKSSARFALGPLCFCCRSLNGH